MSAQPVDEAQIAVDFVLALEHPCMQHIPHPANPPSEDPDGHQLLMSTPLMSQTPTPPQPNSSWAANPAIIKELLNLSASINLQGEITPVEAWHRIRQHPDYPRLDRLAIERLRNELSGAVRCCGYAILTVHLSGLPLADQAC